MESYFDPLRGHMGAGSGYPPASPLPGFSSPWPEFAQGADVPMHAPQPGVMWDPRNWGHHAVAGALAFQMAITNPFIRARLGDLIDKAMRVSFKPVAFPPWQEKPFRGEYFGGVTEATLTAGATFVDLAEFVMPEGDMAVIREFGIGLEDAADISNFHVRVLVNDVPVVPLQDVTCLIGTPDNPHFFSIIVQGGGSVKIQGRADGGSDIGANIWLLGWRWPAPSAGGQDHADAMSTVGG